MSRVATTSGHCQRGRHGLCGFTLRTATGWNWWCTCGCHPEPTLADAAPDSGAERAIEFWRTHRSAQISATSGTDSNDTGSVSPCG